MKRQFIFGLIALILASLACQSPLRPTDIPLPAPSLTPTITITPTLTLTPTPTITPTPPLTTSGGPALVELHMFTPTRGWGLTKNQILITNDGGRHWAQVPLPGVTLDPSVSAYFVNSDIAYFLAPFPGTEFGQLFATRDGGATWLTSPTLFQSAKLYFVDDNVGFALQTLSIGGDWMRVAIYQTLDRGASWTQVFAHAADQTFDQDDQNLPVRGVKTGISFVNPSQGALGLSALGDDVGLYHTDDSGRTWVKQQLTLPDGITDGYQTTVWPAFFFPGDLDNGIVAVDFLTLSGIFTRGFYATQDTGVSWEKRGELPGGGVASFIDSNTGWAWSDHNLYTTSDGATTWTQIPAAFGPSENATILDFADAQNGWIITVDAKNVLRMYRSTDGGETWVAIIP